MWDDTVPNNNTLLYSSGYSGSCQSKHIEHPDHSGKGVDADRIEAFLSGGSNVLQHPATEDYLVFVCYSNTMDFVVVILT